MQLLSTRLWSQQRSAASDPPAKERVPTFNTTSRGLCVVLTYIHTLVHFHPTSPITPPCKTIHTVAYADGSSCFNVHTQAQRAEDSRKLLHVIKLNKVLISETVTPEGPSCFFS